MASSEPGKQHALVAAALGVGTAGAFVVAALLLEQEEDTSAQVFSFIAGWLSGALVSGAWYDWQRSAAAPAAPAEATRTPPRTVLLALLAVAIVSTLGLVLMGEARWPVWAALVFLLLALVSIVFRVPGGRT